MSNYIWILDAGHGGMKKGAYTTAPGKMHIFSDGLTVYEGVNNREIVRRLVKLLETACIEHALVHDEEDDTPLEVRVRRANNMHAKDARCIYVSVHSDAMPDGSHGKGSGLSVWTSVGETRSDKVANIFCQVYEKDLHEYKFRKDALSDGDSDHEENFYVLRWTKCPALLTENLFFDNRHEAEFLLSDAGRDRIARALFDSIVLTEQLKPI